MSVTDTRALRDAFGSFLTGVTVVTAHNDLGQPVGFTANSFTSVSLDPPLVLVCLANTSRNFETFTKASGFAVNILSEDQTEISNTFAGKSEDRFGAVDWSIGPEGSPILQGTAAWFDCVLSKTVEAGDHVILIGEVKAFDQQSKPGLGYARGAYITPSTTLQALAPKTNLVVSALIEHEGQVLLIDDGNGALSLPEASVSDKSVSDTLKGIFADLDITAAPGFVYSVFEDKARRMQHISFLCQAEDRTPSKGTFVPLTSATLDDIGDPAILTMLERFAAESAVGSFGIYYGDQSRGEVRAMNIRGS